MSIPLILDTDIGDDVDDVFALLLAALHPDVAFLGVTTVYGDAPQRARIARKLLDLAGKPSVPVATGLGVTLGGRDPLQRQEPGTSMVSARGFVAPPGSSEWDELGSRLERRPAVDFLIETIRGAAEPPVVVAIGPLTNVAAALRRAPEIAHCVQALVLMGGRLGPEAHRGEHNFNSDAEATAVVLGSGAPLQIGTYDVTCQAKIGEAELPRLRTASPACSAAAEQLAHYLEVTRRTATSMYDPLSLTLSYTDRFLATRPVALRWQTDGRLVTLATVEQGMPNAAVSVDLDAPAFVEHLLTTLGV